MGRCSWSTRLTTDQCKSISTYFLNRHRYFNNGGQAAGMTWSRGGEKTGSIWLASFMDKGDEHIHLQYTHTDQEGNKTEIDYRVQLTSTPCYFGGHRWWFLCPMRLHGHYCGRRVGVLYIAGIYFGCRHCYNLTYESSRDSHKFDSFFLRLGLSPRQANELFKRGRYERLWL